MADHTHIEWADATWNPITGCSVVSPGCTNCYAMKLAGGRLRHHPSREGLTVPSKAGPVWNGEVRFNEQWLTQPLTWSTHKFIFVCAHGDLFHPSVPDEWIDKVFAVMALAHRHTFMVLTKRPARMRAYLTNKAATRRIIHEAFKLDCEGGAWMSADHEIAGDQILPLKNVWLGISAEDQARLDERMGDLCATPAAKRFLSIEPLIAPLSFRWGKWVDHDAAVQANGGVIGHLEGLKGIDCVIVGGESGPGARPMHPVWPQDLCDQSVEAGVAFFFKQWGAWAPLQSNDGVWPTDEGGFIRLRPDGVRADDGWPMQRVGKKAAGRVLDGRTWDERPEGVAHG